MTRDEENREIGGAFRERRQLTKTADCLRHRLRTYGRAYVALAGAPFDQKHRDIAARATDLREDWKDLREALDQIDELNKLLDLGEAQ